MAIGSIRGSLSIPLGSNGALAQLSESSSAPSAAGAASLVRGSVQVQEGKRDTILLCSSLSSLLYGRLLLLWLVSALLCHSLAAKRPPRSLSL